MELTFKRPYKKLAWIGKRHDQFTDFAQIFLLCADRFGPHPLFFGNCRILSSNEIAALLLDATDVVWYDELWAYQLHSEGAQVRTEGLNDRTLLETLGHKHKLHRLELGVQRLDGAIVPREEANYLANCKRFPGAREFVLHSAVGSACSGIRRLDSISEDAVIESLCDHEILVTPLVRNSIPCNVHILVGVDGSLVFPPSLQLLTPVGSGRLHYAGCDFSALSELDEFIRKRIEVFGSAIGENLSALGYRGVCGVDFLLAQDGTCCLVEINARFQASTGLINRALRENLAPPVQHLHLEVQSGAALPTLPKLKVKGGILVPVQVHGEAPPPRLAFETSIARAPFGIFPTNRDDIVAKGIPL